MKYIIRDNKIEILESEMVVAELILDDNVIKHIYVLPKYRNISYGRSILNRAIEIVKKKNFDTVLVYEFDEALYNFFEKNGFKEKNNVLVYSGLKKEMAEEKSILNTSFIAFLINLFLAFSKIVIGFVFGIASITADGINAGSDCITNLLVLVGIKISKQPEDKNHPFGHGKIEAIFSIIIGNIIVYSAFIVFLDNVKKIFTTTDTLDLGNKQIFVLAITCLFIFLKILQYFYVRYIAIKYNNILLKAIIKDYLADILVTSSVLIGTILSIYISRLFDIALGIILTLYIIYQGISIIYENALTLMDTQDEKLLSEIKNIILSNNDIQFVHDMFMISYANDIYVFADIRVDKNLSVEVSHQIAEKMNVEVRRKIKNVKRLTLHVEPIY